MAVALRDFFLHNMHVRLYEVQPSPIDDAFMRFGSPIEREHFLDRVIQFGPRYTLRFTKHDEGVHVREHDMDREVWIMLMLFPNDSRNNSALAKAVVGFGLVRYWYDTTNNSRVVVKVFLHDEARIPDDVVVSAGIEPRVSSWTCHVVILKRKNFAINGDEDLFPPADGGVAHPVPPQPPRWMGMHGPAHNPQNQVVGEGSHSAQGPSGDVDMSNAASGDVGDVDNDRVSDILDMNNVSNGDSAPVIVVLLPDNVAVEGSADGVSPSNIVVPLIPPGFEQAMKVNNTSISFFFPSLNPTPSCFDCLSRLSVDLDILVPSYISDDRTLYFLASILVDDQ